MLILVILSPGCSKRDKTLSAIRARFEKGQYEESVALCKKALEGGHRSGEVYFYYGLSLFYLGRDSEALNRLGSAALLEPAISSRIGDSLFVRGKADLERGKEWMAGHRLKEAVRFKPAIHLGPLAFLVGDFCFREKDYEKAVYFYREALRSSPDTSLAAPTYLRLASAYRSLGATEKARESLEKLLDRFPACDLGEEARWEIATLIYREAEAACHRGNYEEVPGLVEELLDKTENESLIQRARLLLGEAFEGMGNYEAAYEQYKEVVRNGGGASVRAVVEKAREKIEEFKKAGFY